MAPLWCHVWALAFFGVAGGARSGRSGTSTRDADAISGKKVRFAKRGSINELPHVDYPITKTIADTLKGTDAVSVRWLGHRQVRKAFGEIFYTSEDPYWWWRAMGSIWGRIGWDDYGSAFKPSHPDGEAEERKHFWSDWHEVLVAQQMRRAHKLTSSVMPVHPLFDQDITMEESAHLVRADFPTNFPTMQIERFLKQKSLKLDPNIFALEECNAGKEFVNGAVALGGLIGWAVAQVSPAAFGSKWYVGRIRPEEIAFMVNSGDLDVEEDVRQAITDMDLKTGADFTAFDEGSPMHPSWPAMHSAASSMSAWLEVVANLTESQRAEVRLLDFSIAYWRTFAGVHYPTDNRAGLALGQYIIKRSLPEHLADMYSCDSLSKGKILAYVQRKVEEVEEANPLNWGTYTPHFWNPPSTLLKSS